MIEVLSQPLDNEYFISFLLSNESALKTQNLTSNELSYKRLESMCHFHYLLLSWTLAFLAVSCVTSSPFRLDGELECESS